MKYRKKPIIIEAIQWTGRNIEEMFNFAHDKISYSEKYETFFIDTLEGSMKANIGDFIIKGINNEFYPCKPDIFNKTYELIVE